jgi:hypothetical protein
MGNPFTAAIQVIKTLNGDAKQIGDLSHKAVKAFQETDEGRIIVISLVALTLFNAWFWTFGTAGLAFGGFCLFSGYYLSDSIDKLIGTILPSAIKWDRIDDEEMASDAKADKKRIEEDSLSWNYHQEHYGLKPVGRFTQKWRQLRGNSTVKEGEFLPSSIPNSAKPKPEETLNKIERLTRGGIIATALLCFILPAVGVVAGYALRHSPTE